MNNPTNSQLTGTSVDDNQLLERIGKSQDYYIATFVNLDMTKIKDYKKLMSK